MNKNIISGLLSSLLLIGSVSAYASDNAPAQENVAQASAPVAANDKSRCVISENELFWGYHKRHPTEAVMRSKVWAMAVVAAAKSCQVGGTVILRDPSKASYGYPNVTTKNFLELYCDIMDIKKLDTGDYACKITQSVDWHDAVKRHNVQYNQEYSH